MLNPDPLEELIKTARELEKKIDEEEAWLDSMES